MPSDHTIAAPGIGAIGAIGAIGEGVFRARYADAPMGYTDAPPGWWREFNLAPPAKTAKLAVVRADGPPHVAPVWVDLDGDQVVFMTSADTVTGAR